MAPALFKTHPSLHRPRAHVLPHSNRGAAVAEKLKASGPGVVHLVYPRRRL